MAGDVYSTLHWEQVRTTALTRDRGRCTIARSAENGRFNATSELERFAVKIEIDSEGCWIWKASLTSEGYGQFWWNGRQSTAHSFAYEWFIASVPEGHVIDHLCRNRACANPEHLEAVTQRENILRGESPSAGNARKTHCSKGHEFSPENTKVLPDGERRCRICTQEVHRRAWGRASESRRREKHRFYNSARWRILRDAAISRDGGRCSVSYLFGGECSDRLHVHHIVPVTEGGEELDLDNLLTVCASHHPMLESLRRSVLRDLDPDWRSCPHKHTTAEGRRQCEARLNRSQVAA